MPPKDEQTPRRDSDLRAPRPAVDESTLGVGSSPPGTDSGDHVQPAFDTISGYEILSEIYRGGQGVVYQAIQKATRRRVAIKVMREGPFAGSRDKARFEREVQILASLNHPGLVAIYDSGTAGGSFYYVMDYIHGHSLDAWASNSRRKLPEVLRLFAKICDAVNAAHLHGVIHRDLKPANIRVDPAGEPHVLDFGLAKTAAGAVTDDSRPEVMTLTGHFMGSLPWASPEQAEGMPGKIDIRTDVYSLGVMLFQILTGEFPYSVFGSMQEVLQRIMHAEPASPGRSRPELRGEVETIILKCLSKERERRYQSAGELARDIRHFLAGEPIDAKRDSALYVLRKTLRRYRAPVAAVAAFLLLTAVSLVVTAALWRSAAEDRDRTARAEREARQAQQLEATQRHEADLQRDAAVVAGKKADAERARADSRAQLARQRLYYCQIRLAESEYVANPLRMKLLLDECPPDLRCWEWYRLRWLADRSLMTLHGQPIDPWISLAIDSKGRLAASGGPGGTARVFDVNSGREIRSLPGHARDTFALAFSPDDTRLVTGDSTGSVRVFDVTSGNKVQEFLNPAPSPREQFKSVFLSGVPNPHQVVNLAYSPDGRWLIFCRRGGTLQIRDAASGDEVWSTSSLANGLTASGFSPDGRFIATGAMEGQVDLWDVALRRRIRILSAQHPMMQMIRAIAFSADGQHVLAAPLTGLAEVWSTDTGLPVCTIGGWQYSVESAVFSPDGSQILTGCDDGAIRIWDATNGAEKSILRGHAGHVAALRLSRDGSRIISASGDGTVKVWSPLTSADVRQFRAAGPVLSLAVSPDSRLVAAAGKGRAIQLWDVAEGRELSSWQAHPGSIYALDYAPDGLHLASGGSDNAVRFWDTKTGAEYLPPASLSLSARAVVYSPDGRLVAAASGSGLIRVLSALTGSEVLTLRNETRSATAVAFSPDGGQLCSASSDGKIQVWSLARKERVLTLSGHEGAVNAVVFSPDGNQIASAGADATLRVWDSHTGGESASLRGHKGPVLTVAFTPDGRRIASGGEDATIRLWDPGEREEIHILRGHEAAVQSIRFCPNGMLVSGSSDGSVCLWETSLRAGPSRQAGFHLLVNGGWKPDWSPDGRCIAYGLPRGQGICVLDLETGDTRRLTDNGKDPAWSPDGRSIAYVFEKEWHSRDEEVRVISVDGGVGRTIARGNWPSWSSDSRHLRFHLALTQALMQVDVSDPNAKPTLFAQFPHAGLPVIAPDGKRIAFDNGQTPNPTLVIMDATTKATLRRFPLPPNYSGFLGLAWSPNGTRLAAGDENCVLGLRILDVPTGQWTDLAGECFVAAAWSPDGRKLAFDSRGANPDNWQVWMIDLPQNDRPTTHPATLKSPP